MSRRADDARGIDLNAAIRALAHRGPDDSGTFSGTANGVYCGLAHTRLAIIDLTPRGQQPMRSADGRYVMVYNGEVYNHRELRSELEADGVRLRGSSDTEVILETYARRGAGALARFEGMFALAVWDLQRGDLFLARDRMGIKPLYFTTKPIAGIAFASEVRALLATGTAAPKLSLAGVAGYLQWGAVPEPHTILEGVETLAPGACLTYRNGEAAVVRYWQPSLNTTACSFDEAVEQVTPVLARAVSSHLIADVPVGVFLSGGIDSSVITALAAAASSKPVHTFNVAFDEASSDESAHARLVASRFGCTHHEILLRPDQIRAEIDLALGAMDQPSADGTNTFIVAKPVREAGISVVLSGLGGDELFAGYPNFKHFAKAVRVAGLLPHSTSGLLDSLMSLDGGRGRLRRAHKLAGLLTAQRDPFGAYAALRCMFTPVQVARLLRSQNEAWRLRADVGADRAIRHALGGHIDMVNLYSALELGNYVRDTLLRDADAMSMAHGLEVRVPLLDHKLLEHVLAVPGHLKLPTHVNKPLLVAAAPRLPEQIVRRPKMGFTLPWDSWLRGGLRDRMEHLLDAQSMTRLGVLDGAQVALLWRAFLGGDRSVTHSRVWCIAALAAWCETNRVSL